jgi:quercetin dioxygenase-like cupin family protein
MRHFYYAEIPLEDISAPAVGAKRRWLLTKEKGSPNFTVAFVEVAPGGSTLRHSHSYEHAMYFLEGVGELQELNGISPISPWEFIYIAPDELHQIKNTGNKSLKFIGFHMKEGFSALLFFISRISGGIPVKEKNIFL